MKRFLQFQVAVLLLLAACAPTTGKQISPSPTTSVSATEQITAAPTETAQPSPTRTPNPTAQNTTTRTPEPEPPNWIAFVGLDGNVTLVDAKSGEQRAVTEDGSTMQGAHANAFITYSSPAWSSDGRLLVFKKARNAGSSGQEYLESMQVYDLNSQESKEILAGEWVSGFAWQPGTHLLAYSLMVNPNYFESDGNVNAKLAAGILGIDVDSAEITELVQPQRYSLVSPQWSPDGRFLSFNEVLYMEGSGNFAYYDFQDESYTRWVRPIGNYSWSHDGESLVYDYQIYIPDGMESIQLNDRFDEGETLLWEPEDGLFSVNPLFSPDDEQIIFKEGEPFQDVTLIDLLILDLESGESESILEQAEVYDIQWSPDGEFILALIGPYDNPTLLEINAYDYTTRVLAHGWWPAWQPLSE